MYPILLTAHFILSYWLLVLQSAHLFKYLAGILTAAYYFNCDYSPPKTRPPSKTAKATTELCSNPETRQDLSKVDTPTPMSNGS